MHLVSFHSASIVLKDATRSLLHRHEIRNITNFQWVVFTRCICCWNADASSLCVAEAGVGELTSRALMSHSEQRHVSVSIVPLSDRLEAVEDIEAPYFIEPTVAIATFAPFHALPEATLYSRRLATTLSRVQKLGLHPFARTHTQVQAVSCPPPSDLFTLLALIAIF